MTCDESSGTRTRTRMHILDRMVYFRWHPIPSASRSVARDWVHVRGPVTVGCGSARDLIPVFPVDYGTVLMSPVLARVSACWSSSVSVDE